MEIVIIPAWRRPDFLYACLERLRLADDGQQEYWVSLDRGFDYTCEEVVLDFQQAFDGRLFYQNRSHSFHGNSYNVLMSYKDACETDASLIHLVEEDIFVGSDYFQFHRKAHELCPDVFAVSACRNQNHPFPVERQPEAFEDVVYTHRSYQSLAVSFKPQQLARILPHVQSRYFSDMVGYCTRTFPQSKLQAAWSEQDGLLHRTVERDQLETAYGAVPRAYHAGFVGYNRQGKELAGDFESRAEKLLRMDSAALNARAISIPDHEAFNLDAARTPVSRVLKGWS
jgi:hypothetical protein